MAGLFYSALAVLGCRAADEAPPLPFYGWAERPVMGWNSWDNFATTITEAQTREIADILAAKLAPVGYRVLTVDIQWYEPHATGFDYRPGAALTMDAWGRLLPAPNRFPSSAGGQGFKPLADYIHSRGLRFGLHLMRGIPRQAVEARTPILGSDRTAADIADRSDVCAWNKDMYGVDMTKPGAQAYYDSVLALYASWGLDFIKVDDLSRPFHVRELEAIRLAIDHCGAHIVLSTSPGATPIAAGPRVMRLANQWRVSDDMWDHWPQLRAQFDLLRDWTPFRGPGHFPDADMLPVGTIALGKRQSLFTPDEQRTLLTLWSIARSPLILGADPRRLDAATLAVIANPEVIAVDQESEGNRELLRQGDWIVWAADVPGQPDRYVALFNTGEAAASDLTLDLAKVGFPDGARVRDLWAHREIARHLQRLQADVPAHGAALFRIAPDHRLAAGPFAPTWESLAAQYRAPEWFRDAKFGLWAHWSAQCVPERGDWYAREMYIQGSDDYAYQVSHYGHPSDVGFMELDHLWTAAHWDPERLMALYARAGAKYFVALANHHDNFDTYDSKYQPWNAVRIGPKRDIVGTWARLARAHGLRFGVSNHSSHAWHWFQVAYGHDVEGPLAGVPYDAAALTPADGKGKWWEGLDPADLYGGLRLPLPATLASAAEARRWHDGHDGHWYESVPPCDEGYTEKWFLRAQDLVDKYHPDLVYLDDDELPLGQAGLDFAAHYYNANRLWHGGNEEGVLDAKHLTEAHAPAVVQDIERGVSEAIRPVPWQTDTCIGSWHYDRRIFLEHRYKTVPQVVRMLVDIVSKNGNLLLSVPVRGDGTIDSDEEAFLRGMGDWMSVNGEAIFSTRPWRVYGEGPSTVASLGKGPYGGGADVPDFAFTARDIRFTTKAGSLYAIFLGWPDNARVDVTSLPVGAGGAGRVSSVSLLGSADRLSWNQDGAGLHVTLPSSPPCQHAYVLKIGGVLRPEGADL